MTTSSPAVPKTNKKKDKLVSLKTSFNTKFTTELNVHKSSELPSDDLRSLSPSTHSHLDVLLLCSSDSWCWRVRSEEKEREAGSQKPHMHHQQQFSTAAQIMTNQWKRTWTSTKQWKHTSSKYCHGKKKTKKEKRNWKERMNLVPKKTITVYFRGQRWTVSHESWSVAVIVPFCFVSLSFKKREQVRK